MGNIKEILANNLFYDIKDAFGRAIVASEFNSNLNYEVGDLVLYGDFLYKCLSSCSGNWNWNNWSKTTLLDLYDGGNLEIELEYDQDMVDEFRDFLINRATITSCSRNIKAIRSAAFYGCFALTTAEFPECITIGSYAFRYCSSLQSISLPKCINIDSAAFSECTSLLSVYLLASSICTLANVDAFESSTMVDSSYTGTFGSIYVPTSLVDSYKAATNWITYADRITAFTG